jgi:tetratricopeptide (TPR) repeat protein
VRGEGATDQQPLTVEFTGVELAADPLKLRRYEIQLLTLRLWANPFDTQAYLDRGRRHFRDEAWRPAHADFDWAFRLDPRLWQARHNRALTGSYLGRWQQVRSDADAVLAEHPEKTALVHLRALACQQLADHAQAIADLTDLIVRSPADPHLYELRATSYAALGRQAEAEADCKKSVALTPNDANALNARAWQLLVGDGPRDAATALQLAERAVKLDPKPYYWNTLGVAYYRSGRYPDAVTALEKSLARHSDLPAGDWLFLAMCHHRLGDRIRADKEFERAVRWLQANEAKLSPEQRRELSAFRTEAEALLRGSR